MKLQCHEHFTTEMEKAKPHREAKNGHSFNAESVNRIVQLYHIAHSRNIKIEMLS